MIKVDLQVNIVFILHIKRYIQEDLFFNFIEIYLKIFENLLYWCYLIDYRVNSHYFTKLLIDVLIVSYKDSNKVLVQKEVKLLVLLVNEVVVQNLVIVNLLYGGVVLYNKDLGNNDY